MKDLRKHQVNALYTLGGTILGFLLTYSLISYNVSKRTQEAYYIGYNEGYEKSFKIGYTKGFNDCYDEVEARIDSLSVKLTTLSILLNN